MNFDKIIKFFVTRKSQFCECNIFEIFYEFSSNGGNIRDGKKGGLSGIIPFIARSNIFLLWRWGAKG